MQGMNFNYDSTYIQNTIQENEKPQTLDFSEKSESSVSFMQMVSSARNDVYEADAMKIKPESVQTTDTEVEKVSNDAELKVEETASANREVEKTETNSDKKEITEKKEDETDKKVKSELSESNSFIARLMNSSEKKSQVKDSDVKTAAAKKAFNTFKDVNSVSGAQRIADLKEKVDDAKLSAIIHDFKNLKLDKKDSDEDSALMAGLLATQDFKKTSEIDTNLLQKTDSSNHNFKDLKVKKADKKIGDVISVTDLRTDKNESVNAVKKSSLTTTMKQTSHDTVAVTMDLNNQAEKNILSLDSQTAGAQGSNFQAMLENQIFENSADFVKAGKIVLKDNDVGNIDLILHPASLGNVKISLELSDKVITGKILVSSQQALDAFNATQDSLKAAFIESGFDGASFDVAFANQNPDFSNANQNQQDNSRQAEKAYSNYLVENTSVEESNSDIYNEERDYSLNIVA